MRPFVWLGWVLVLVLGCGDSAGGPRSGVGGTGGAGHGGAGTGGAGLCNCEYGQECADDGRCISICGDVPACIFGGTARCCGEDLVCLDGGCVTDCGDAVECNRLCCDTGQVCYEGACVADCPHPARLCGADNELCCSLGQACIGEVCATLGDPCTVGEDCELDEFCEPSVQRCVSRDAVRVCEFRPPTGVFEPKIACRWEPPPAPDGASAEEREIAAMAEVVMTPSVANLTDDNGDGVTDTRDTPDIVFVSFDRKENGCCTGKGVVRVVSGACNEDGSMTTLATLRGESGDWIGNSTGIALGNLHPDDQQAERVPEIVATFKEGGTVAWRRTSDDGSSWEVLWQNDALPTRQHTRGGAQPSIADLDGDGRPEVIIGNVVLDGPTGKGPDDPDLPPGAIAWDGLDLESTIPSANLGIGNNAFLGPASTVADLDQDGFQEVIAGNTVYNYDGTVRWTHPYTTTNSYCDGSLDCDGYNAVGNFDEDKEAEVVIVRLGELFILNHDGTPVPGIPLPIRIPGHPNDVRDPTYLPSGYTPDQSLYNEYGNLLPPERILCGGPLTLAAYDSDGERIMSGGDPVFVRTAGDNESGPPTVADFDGDGFAEIGTASSTAYVVLDLQCTGDPLPEECQQEWVRWMVENDDCSSRVTGSSVFDFEGDGSAEVVYADENTFRIFDGKTGTILYEDKTHDSNTRMEMPIVVDVDNDGKSEVVVPEPNHHREDRGGIDVWEAADNNWVRTRRIWNQHAYSVTNVTEDGQIPRRPEPNWQSSRLNNFRQNVQPSGLFDAPDFVVRDIYREHCDDTAYTITIEVGNDGALSVPPGIDVYVVIETVQGGERFAPDGGNPLKTTDWLLPGGSEKLTFVFTIPDGLSAPEVRVLVSVDDDGEGGAQYNECDEGNNAATSNPISCPVVE